MSGRRGSGSPGSKFPDERRDFSGDYCWGRNPVISMLEASPSRCLKVFIARTMQAGVAGKIVELCRESGIIFTFVETRALDSMLDGESHQGVAAVVSPTPVLDLPSALDLLPDAPAPALAVLLDRIQDPRNLGAIIRSAEAAGASFAAVPARRSSLPTGTVAKASAGASLRLPLAVTGNVANAVRDCQGAGLWTVGLDAKANRTIYDAPLPSRCLMVVGGEGDGISRTTASACDEMLRIPTEGCAGSLNASVALSVGMFEWHRINRRSEAYEFTGNKKLSTDC
jgi:23S rRNA (guanosine2251-2'-O)-methyltransferase